MCLLSSTFGNNPCYYHSHLYYHTAQRAHHLNIRTSFASSSASSQTIMPRLSWYSKQSTYQGVRQLRKSRAKPRVERIRDALQYLQHASESKMKTFGWKSCDNYSKSTSSVILFITFPGPTSEQRRSSGSSQSFLFLGGGRSCPYIHGEAIQHKCIESFFVEC